jgi:hypothetical protein
VWAASLAWLPDGFFWRYHVRPLLTLVCQVLGRPCELSSAKVESF